MDTVIKHVSQIKVHYVGVPNALFDISIPRDYTLRCTYEKPLICSKPDLKKKSKIFTLL